MLSLRLNPKTVSSTECKAPQRVKICVYQKYLTRHPVGWRVFSMKNACVMSIRARDWSCVDMFDFRDV